MNEIKMFVSWILTCILYLIGGMDIALISLVIFMVADYITGLLKATKKNQLNSKIGIEGIKKKIGMIVLVVVVSVLDRLVGNDGIIRTPVIYFMVANEGISILENLGQMGIPIPKIILKKLEQLKGEDYE